MRFRRPPKGEPEPDLAVRPPDLLQSREVGLAFTIVCDLGFAVGLCTHKHARMGHLVWLAVPFFDEFPTLAEVEEIEAWRWPVFFPLGAALRRRIVDRVGRVAIPPALVPFPTLRAGGDRQPWMEYRDGKLGGLGPATRNRDLPIEMIVNDTRLKEMLITGWTPADMW